MGVIRKYTNLNQKVGRYFTAWEFACPHCNECFIDDELVNILDTIREEIKSPVIITSGYRCKKHNIEIGGAPQSKHMLGIAADIISPKLTLKELFRITENILGNRGGLGYYPARGFIHIDTRKEAVRWYEIKFGVYLPLTQGKKKLLGLA